MLELVRALAEAKNRRDLSAALKVQHAEMVLESPAFGAVARGIEENERALARFFKTFPDYDIELDGHAANANDFVCWGTVRMTMVGERFGVATSGRRAVLPVFMRFTFKHDLIVSEYFLIDLAMLCAQSGVSTDAVQAKLLAR